MQYFKEIIEVFKVLKESHLPPVRFITNYGDYLVEQSAEPTAEFLMLATYSVLEPHDKRDFFEKIDTSGFEPSISAGIYCCLMYHLAFTGIISSQSNLNLLDWMEMITSHAKNWIPLKEEYEFFKNCSDMAFKQAHKHLTFENYDKDEFESGHQANLKNRKTKEAIFKFRDKLKEKGNGWENIFELLSRNDASR